ncbi:TIGR03619 family F420-dependent LLM class oxidoreductase [Myxococcota bacterium]|nr:TIGR03619 family F420-dependent LLM class oxidoreductase [Myxococcota bacterium]
MKFWQSLIFCESDQLLGIAKIAEDVGYEGVVLPDHVALPEKAASSYPYSEYELDPRAPFLDPWPAIAAMAAVTTRLRFATYVYILPMRDPFSVAKSLATTAILSGGRVVLGLGVGWLAEEMEVLGHSFAGRGARSDEMIEIMRRLWRDGSAEYHGRYFDFERVHAEPRPGHPIPIWVGGHTEAAIRRAARSEGWMGLDFAVDEIPAVVERIRRARREEGRDSGPFEIILSPRTEPTTELYRRLEAMGVTGVILPAWSLMQGDYSSLDAKRRQMEGFAGKFS